MYAVYSLRYASIAGLALLLAASAGVLAQAQQATIGTPMHGIQDGFFEQSNVRWGLNWPGGFFRFGPTPTAPQFGGYDSNAGARFGGTFGGRNLNGFFTGEWSQGSRRSMTGQTPIVTTYNGFPASIVDQSLSPFVMGMVPIVGDEPQMQRPSSGAGPDAVRDRLRAVRRSRNEPSTGAAVQDEAMQAATPRKPALASGASSAARAGEPSATSANEASAARDDGANQAALARQSSAGRAVMSVAEARRLRQEELRKQNDEARELMAKAQSAESEGRLPAARSYYQSAARRANGELKQEIQNRLDALAVPATP